MGKKWTVLAMVFSLLALGMLGLYAAGCNSGGSGSALSPTNTGIVAGGPDNAAALYVLSGKVTDYAGTTLLAGVACSLQKVDSTGEKDGTAVYTTTNELGEYSFGSLTSGDYQLGFDAQGYISSNHIFSISANRTIDDNLMSVEDWNSSMGADYPYSPDLGYVFAQVVDDRARALLSGVDLDMWNCSFLDCGYIANDVVQWGVTETRSDGTGVFYGVLPEQAFQIQAYDDSHSFEAIGGQVEAGEILYCEVRGTAIAETFPSALQRVIDNCPIKGLCYKPAPSDYRETGTGTYYDSDFCNSDYPKLWGSSGRNDIGNLSSGLNVKFLRYYDWNTPGDGTNYTRDHSGYIQYCIDNGFQMGYSVSNYFVQHSGESGTQANIAKMVQELYTIANGNGARSTVLMWCVSNEWDQAGGGMSPEMVARTVKVIVDKENALNIPDDQRVAITAPATTGLWGDGAPPGASKSLALWTAFKNADLGDVWNNRFIWSFQSQSRDVELKSWIPQISDYFKKNIEPSMGHRLLFMNTEMTRLINSGTETKTEADQQAAYDSLLEATLNFATSFKNNPGGADVIPYLGSCVFMFENAPWRAAPEDSPGIHKFGSVTSYGTTTGGAQYPIDELLKKPNWDAVKKWYQP